MVTTHLPLKHIGAAIVLAAGSCASAGGDAVRAQQGQPTGAPIGIATRERDGTIVLTLRATTGGAIGDGQFRYPPDHPQHERVKAHVGTIPAGGSVPVRPFPSP